MRRQAAFRGWADIESGPARYHLYVALACPWSHRTVIVRRLKGLEDELSISFAHPYRDERGWRLLGDELNGFEFLREAYESARPGYDDRISVPVLWDKEEATIVNNESTDIVRMLNDWGDPDVDLYPEDLRAYIDDLDEWVYGGFQNSVYRAGFARSQEAYDDAFASVFATMERLERCSASAATWPATGSRSPTGGCSRRSCASTPSTTRTSAATGAASSTARTCGTTRASCTSSRASPRRSPWTRSRSTTTRRTTR